MGSLQSLIEGIALTPEQEKRVGAYLKQVAMDEDLVPRVKPCHIGTPAVFKLERCCQVLWESFCWCGKRPGDGEGEYRHGGVYLVGSACDRPDWRDVDIRLLLDDKSFADLFPDAGLTCATWEHDPRWLLMTTAIADWLKAETGLPVDFQFQAATFANEKHKGKRNAMGMRFARKGE